MIELRRVSMVDALADSLRTRVLSGTLSPAIALTEAKVATEFRVSRPTAKCAIDQLVVEGLLQRRANKSARVPVVSDRDLEDLFVVRIPLELAVVHLLADDQVPPAVVSAAHELTEMAATATSREFDRADLQLHIAMMNAVGSPRLTKAMKCLTGEMLLIAIQSHHVPSRDRVVAEHSALLASIRRGDTQFAESLMRTHLRADLDSLLPPGTR